MVASLISFSAMSVCHFQQYRQRRATTEPVQDTAEFPYVVGKGKSSGPPWGMEWVGGCAGCQ